MIYNTNQINTAYTEIYANAISQVSRGNKEFYLRAGNAVHLPVFLKFVQHYCLINNIALYFPKSERITRSSDVRYYLTQYLKKNTNSDEETDQYTKPLLYDKVLRDSLNLKETFGIHIISVEGQIQDTFETHIPHWANDCGAVEQLGISLALKLTPKHRVRVYTRNDHIIVFTTKGVQDAVETDYAFFRAVFACIPLLRGWMEREDKADYEDVIELCKALTKPDAKYFWDLLNQFVETNPVIKDLKYSTIIQAFNSMSVLRQNNCISKLQNITCEIERILNSYSTALNQKQDLEQELLYIQSKEETLDTAVIKTLVVKKICYQLDISDITGSSGRISYRCSAPLLSYDKDAARMTYNKRVKARYSDSLAELFKLIFIDEKVVLVFDEAIDIMLNRNNITARNGNTRIWVDLDKSFPNPHHYNHNCWGSYGPVILKLINEHKLEELFYQIKAAVGSLNFTDSIVIGGFLTMFESIVDGDYNPACFTWRDENCSTLHTARETLEHFKEEATE